MATPNSVSFANQPVAQAMPVLGQRLLTKKITVASAADPPWHLLNDAAFTFIPAGTTGDIATLSIAITNLSETLNLEYAGAEQAAGAITDAGVILPGMTRILGMGRLGEVAIRNPSTDTSVDVSIEVISQDR